jgi:hypothetical protein
MSREQFLWALYYLVLRAELAIAQSRALIQQAREQWGGISK